MSKILVYDDDVDILEVCSAILKFRGLDILCKDNCRHLLADIEGYLPDVILMDNWLPDMGGVRAIQLIKRTEHTKNIPVIFFSANNSVEELAKEAGSDYMLKKPFEIADLENMIAKAIQNSVQ